MAHHRPLARIVRLLFWLALVFAFVMATLPAPPQVLADDKSQHMLAFGVLTALMGLGWPGFALWRIAVVMGVFGALIELVQLMIPQLGREADIADWRADMYAVFAVLLVLGLLRSGRRRRDPEPAK